MSMDHKPRRPKRFCPEAIEASDLLRAFLERSARGRDLTLAELWRHWDTVLGRGLASLALPVGHREATLLVAAEDHLVMQELSFMTTEILERVNAFLEEERFQEVHLSLLGRQRPLNAPPSTPNSQGRAMRPPMLQPDPAKLGALWDRMDPNTPIGRCYRAYVLRFGKKK